MVALSDTPEPLAGAAGGRPPGPIGRDGRFFLFSAIAMTAVIIAGFSFQLAMGRSSFGAPPLVHVHAVVFMGWVVINLTQAAFAATGRLSLHRRLGWVATGWVLLMIVLGCAVTVALVRAGRVPFFFRPAQFLALDPISVFAFAGLTFWAVGWRRRTDWHRRLHFCAMAILLGPAVGRLIPAPFLIPWVWEWTAAICLIPPVIGVVFDLRRDGRVHPAWLWGLAATFAAIALTEAVAYSPAGTALYRAVAAGSPGAAIDPLAFPPPPFGPPPK